MSNNNIKGTHMKSKLFFVIIIFSLVQIWGQNRPRLLFSQSDIQNIRTRVLSGPQEVKNCWNALLADCNHFLTNYPDLGVGWSQYLIVGKLGFAHLIQEGDPNGYGQRALDIVQYEINQSFNFTTQNINDEPTKRATSLAYALDFCDDILTTSFRETIKTKLLHYISTGERPTITTNIGGNNHEIHYAATLGIAALSLDNQYVYDEDQHMVIFYHKDDDLNLAKSRILNYFNGLWDREGAPFEAENYGVISLSYILPLADALLRTGDNSLYQCQGISKMDKWYAYELLPQRYTDSNDYEGYLNSKWNNDQNSSLYWTEAWDYLSIAAEFNSGLAYWEFLQTMQNMNPSHLNVFLGDDNFGHGTTQETDLIIPILKFNTMAPIDPQTVLPTSFYFQDRGLIYLRSGFDNPNDLQFSFESRLAMPKNAYNFHWHHDESDKNSFTLNLYGVNFATDPGYWGTWQTQGHNYITINNYGESHNYEWASAGNVVTFIDGNFGSFMHGDAKSAFSELYHQTQVPPYYYELINNLGTSNSDHFNNSVMNADRYLTLVKGNNGIPIYLLIADDIQKDNSNYTYNWYLQSPLNYTSNVNNKIHMGTDPYMDLYVVSPTTYSVSSPFSIQSNSVNPYYHVILYPHKGSILEPISVTPTCMTNGSYAEINWGNYKDYSILKNFNDGNNINNYNYPNVNLFTTNCKQSLLRKEISSGKIKSFSIGEGSLMLFENNEILNSNGIKVSAINSGNEVVVNTSDPNVSLPSLSIFAPNATSLLINGQSVSFSRINDNIYYPFATISSPITENQTWSGIFRLDNEVVLGAYSTLNITPGTIINFNTNASLVVTGTLMADAFGGSQITFQHAGSPGTNNIIYFTTQLSSAPPSVLKNVLLSNIDGIQCIYGANVDIEECTFRRNIHSIYIYDTEPTIINNLIDDPQENGIYGEASELSPLIQGNTITKVTDKYNYQGIYLGNATCPTILNNTINGFWWGAYLGGGCVSWMVSDGMTNCNNIITDNYVGLGTGWGSETITGYGFHWIPGFNEENLEGFNSIFSNTNYNAYIYQESHLQANDDFWGNYDESQLLANDDYNELKIYTDGSSITNIDGALLSDPCNGINRSIQKNGTKNHTLNKSVSSDIINGLGLEKQGKINEAIAFYKNLINKDSFVKPSLTRLALIKNKYSKPEITNYFENQANNHNKHYGKIKKFLGDIYLKDKKFDDAMTAYNDVINNSSTDYDAINARFEKLFAYFHVKNNISMASQILSELKDMNLTDQEHLIRLNIVSDLIDGANIRLNKKASTISVKIPLSYELSQNYPNPFNPNTIISYSLPKPGNVTLKVYDILGKEVASLVNEYKSEGNYNVNFNASRFASGVYIYQLRANDIILSKKMVLTK
jgi:hypothetical protein